MNSIEYQYLICVYLLIIDSEIHSKEIDFLNNNFPELSEYTKEQAEKIISDSDDKIELSTLIEIFRYESGLEKNNLIEILIQLSINDGFFHTNEKEFIINLAKESQLKLSDVDQLIVKYEEDFKVNYVEKKQSLYSSLKEKLFKKL